MITAAVSKYMSAPPANTATSDQVHAAIVPTDTSVSIVTAPWRRFTSVARWNVHPAHQTTGVESASAHHSHPAKCQRSTIETTSSGRVSTAAGRSRRSTAGLRRCRDRTRFGVRHR